MRTRGRFDGRRAGWFHRWVHRAAAGGPGSCAAWPVSGFLAASFVLGAYLRTPIGALLHGIFPTVPEPYLEMVGYSIAVTVLTFAAHIVTGPFLSKVAVNGVSKEADRALGAVLGGVEAILILSIAIVILDTYFGPNGRLGGDPGLGIFKQLAVALDDSTTADILRQDDGAVRPRGPGSAAPQGRHVTDPRRVAVPARRAWPADREALAGDVAAGPSAAQRPHYCW